MNAYSKDLRLRVLEVVDRGVPRKEVALVEATGRSLSAVTKEDARGFFIHRGYGMSRALSL